MAIVGGPSSSAEHLAMVLAEELLVQDVPVVFIDRAGAFRKFQVAVAGWGLGLKLTRFGGANPDGVLKPGMGHAIGSWVSEGSGISRASILDLSELPHGEQHAFVADFLDALYRNNRRNLHLIVGDADVWAHKGGSEHEQRTLNEVYALVVDGFERNLGITLMTERPGMLHEAIQPKLTLSFLLRLAEQDVTAVAPWVAHRGELERTKVLESLRNLPPEAAWVSWPPGPLVRLIVRPRRRPGPS